MLSGIHTGSSTEVSRPPGFLNLQGPIERSQAHFESPIHQRCSLVVDQDQSVSISRVVESSLGLGSKGPISSTNRFDVLNMDSQEDTTSMMVREEFNVEVTGIREDEELLIPISRATSSDETLASIARNVRKRNQRGMVHPSMFKQIWRGRSRSRNGSSRSRSRPRTILARLSEQPKVANEVILPPSAAGETSRGPFKQSDVVFSSLSEEMRASIAEGLLNCKSNDDIANWIMFMVVPASKELGMTTSLSEGAQLKMFTDLHNARDKAPLDANQPEGLSSLGGAVAPRDAIVPSFKLSGGLALAWNSDFIEMLDYVEDSVEELLIAWPKGRGLHLGKRLRSLLPYSVIWILWRVRNERIFRARMVSIERMVVEVKATLWFWVGYWPGRRFYCFQDLLLRWFELLNGLLVRNGMNVGIA
ncbi:hypothetical protein FRX31_023504 [Thalictrum thalictroides]|uniref:Uncharacterized protein n=1 Tax=Thalictrum thalictroides TaxID=46969 RepID=A0A7J6VQ70_THATH|nr:hypothetical protein FRX31_023504 [Thalictrum thalictroides]